jgi:hypothetical protein
MLIGYNYEIIKQCSEASIKTVRKYISALFVISVLWGIIGFMFTDRYLHGGLLASSIAGILMIVIIVQIEKQIILTVGRHIWANIFRVVIGLVMAILGSVIIDQIMFKDDVEIIKTEKRLKKVEELLPIRAKEIDAQILQFALLIITKEKERQELIVELSQKPTIALTNTIKSTTNDSVGKRLEKVDRQVNTFMNPKLAMLPGIDSLLSRTRNQKNEAENKRANLREELDKEIRAQKGFLDELTILMEIVLSSFITIFVYSLFIIFLLAIELLILIIKTNDEQNDYDLTVKHQMDVKKEMLNRITQNKTSQMIDRL